MSIVGQRIVITRPQAQADELCDRLTALGAIPVLFPTIEIAPLDDYSAVDAAIRELAQYDWIVFTSANGVVAFWSRLNLSGLQDRTSLRRNIAATGPATAHALARRGFATTFVPDEYVAESLAAGLGDVAGQRILIPHAEIARDVLKVELERRGAVVHELPVYRTRPAAVHPARLAEVQGGTDVITFTSSSTVANFVTIANQHALLPLHPLTLVACLGSITAHAALEAGLPVHLVAREHTTRGLVAVLTDYFSQQD
ncbi:MAG TPA: uroporphyrinogen-III synthase [Anaerolineales bacterium]|nr:uroporphyrinogen-III synthase [Anaerolineales bacterium]